jgi:hypothetical protein
VARGGDHAAVPLVAGQHHQLVVLGDGLGGDRDVGAAVEHHLAHLARVALVQLELDLRVALHEAADHVGQHVARLGVGGGDRQAADRLVGELVAHLLQVVEVAQHALGDRQHRAPGLGDRDQTLAVTGEDLDAELGLERRICFDTPGCEVNKASAASDTLSPRRATSCT